MGFTNFQDPIRVPTGSLPVNSLEPGGNMSPDMVEHLAIVQEDFDIDTDGAESVATTYKTVYRARGGETVMAAEFLFDDTGTATSAATFDVEKRSVGGSWSSILTGAVSFSAADADNTAKAGSFGVGDDALAAGDVLRIKKDVTDATNMKGPFAELVIKRPAHFDET